MTVWDRWEVEAAEEESFEFAAEAEADEVNRATTAQTERGNTMAKRKQQQAVAGLAPVLTPEQLAVLASMGLSNIIPATPAVAPLTFNGQWVSYGLANKSGVCSLTGRTIAVGDPIFYDNGKVSGNRSAAHAAAFVARYPSFFAAKK